MSGDDPCAELRAAAAEALPRVVAGSFNGALTFLGEQGNGPAYVLAGAGGNRVTVRVEVTSLPEGTLARLHPNTHSGAHVIQLCGSIAPQAVDAILAIQLGELRAVVDRAARAEESRPADVLVPGPGLPLRAGLTMADAHRLSILEAAAREMGDVTLPALARRQARDRFSFLLDRLGLREAGPATGDAPAVRHRQAIAAKGLRPPAAAALRGRFEG